jgi:hypothetical protein
VRRILKRLRIPPGYLMLLRATCGHLKSRNDLHWTKDYVKFCSPDRASLEERAART